MPSVEEAFVELKRAEMKKAREGAAFDPAREEKERIENAAIVLKRTGKYIVDKDSLAVDFVAQKGEDRTKVTTIEDFILFVEQVEKQYSSATPVEVVSEIRQLWFSDSNWEILVAGKGIWQNKKEVDIETKPNPIAKRFDMGQIAPLEDEPSLMTSLFGIGKKAPRDLGLKLMTRMGQVDIGHVMAGLDAQLSGFPKSYAHSAWKSASVVHAIKYNVMEKASGGSTIDFATWAGDIGQAYATYIFERYVNYGNAKTLKAIAADKASPAQMLGDIHGYVAAKIYEKVPASVSATGDEFKISNVLRDMYLVEKPATGEDMQKYFDETGGKQGDEWKPYIIERVLSFGDMLVHKYG